MPELIYNESRGRYECLSSYAEKDIPKAAGFRWDGLTKKWHTSSVEVAAKLRQYAKPALQATLSEQIAKKQALIEASRATTANVEVPAPSGCEYLPYQKAGIAYATGRPATLIADEMGLGKTIQAIGIANSDPTIRRVLIVCPASLKLNWEREFRKWDVKGLSVGIGSSQCLPDAEVVILNYDVLKNHHSALIARDWDLLISDECHLLKNPKAQRTQALLGAKRWNPSRRQWDVLVAPIPAKRKIFLTGTPIVNKPIELWPLVQALDPNGLGRSKSNYEKRYCGAFQGRWGWDNSGATNLNELQEKLRAAFMVRRLKNDVLAELPAKRRQVIVLDSANLADLLDKEKQAYDAFENAPLETRTTAFSELSRLRHETAVAKIPFLIEHIKETLEQVNKLVVFAHHHDVIDAIHAAFPSSVKIDGRESAEERQKAVDVFQNSADCKLLIGSIKAAGVGLTLTAASTAIFAELDWVPGNVTQAEDRLHRIGQTQPVLIQHLVLNNSLDARMAEILIEKQKIIEKALDKPEEIQK